MRKKLSYVLAIVIMALMVPVLGNARMKSYTWKRYKLKFKMPSHWRITKNTRTKFIAKGGHAVMLIKPYRNRSASAYKVAMYGYRTYRVIKRKRILLKNYGSAKRNRNKYNIFGTGYRGGRKVYFRINGLTSNRTSNNVFVRIWWYGSNDRDNSVMNATRKIGNSLYFYTGRGSSSKSSRMRPLKWKRYRIKFSIPRTWEITKNTKYKFIAKGGHAVMLIKPYRNRSASSYNVAMYAYRTYRVISRKRILLKNYGSAKRKRNKYNIFGTGYRGGKKVYFRIMALTSSRTANNVYCRIWWYGRDDKDNKVMNATRKIGATLRFY